MNTPTKHQALLIKVCQVALNEFELISYQKKANQEVIDIIQRILDYVQAELR